MVCILIVAVVHPLVYVGSYSGDGMIHLVFARNAVQGHLFEFNPGEISGGETSPGFMLVLSTLMYLFGEEIVPVLVKIMSLAMIYLISFFTYRLTKLLNPAPVFSVLAGLITLLMPGSVMNGQIGTENSWFAAGVLGWTYWALSGTWLAAPERLSLSKEFLSGVVLGALFWIRPEAAPFAAIVYGYRVIMIIRVHSRTAWIASLWRGIAALGGFSLVAGLLFWFYWTHTGLMPFSAGLARAVISRVQSSFQLGPVAVNLDFLKRIASFSSLTIPGLLALPLLKRKLLRQEIARPVGLFLTIFGCFFILYSTVLPSVHLARYTIFLWPFLIMTAVITTDYLWHNWPNYHLLSVIISRKIFVMWLALLFIGVVTAETIIRYPANKEVCAGLSTIMSASNSREQTSQRLFDELGPPTKLPVSIAVQEVQIRYWLDQRFIVRSLDGITDVRMLAHICDGYYDHIGYFIERDIDFVTEFPNYNKNKALWSLADLKSLETGRSISRGGITLRKLPSGAVKIEKNNASDEQMQLPCTRQKP